MITLLQFLALFSVLASAILAVMLARSFRQRERLDNDWRERERKLIDQLLTNNGQKPLVRYEREQVVTVPDPNAPQLETPWDRAFFESEIVEEIEHAMGLSPQSLTVDQAKAQYPREWKEYERRLRAEKAPLRIS